MLLVNVKEMRLASSWKGDVDEDKGQVKGQERRERKEGMERGEGEEKGKRKL